jgi:hypothetical protein
MRIRSTLGAIALAAAVTAGCGGDGNGTSPLGYLGRYGLVSVDGAVLPLTVYDTPTLKLTVTSGATTLNADNTFVEDIHIDVVANGFPGAPEVGTCTGTFQRSGNTVTMTSVASETCVGGTSTGMLNGKTLTVDIDGSTLVFRR